MTIKQHQPTSGHGVILAEALALAFPSVVYIVAWLTTSELQAFSVRVAIVVAILVSIAFSFAVTRRAPRALLLLLAIFVTYAGVDHAFRAHGEWTVLAIKMRTTFNHLFVIAIVLWGANSRQPFLKTILGEILPLPKRKWVIFTRICIVGYVIFALLNELIWRNFSESFWVGSRQFPNVLVYVGLLVLLVMSIRSSRQLPLIGRLGNGDLEGRRTTCIDRWMLLFTYSGLHVAPVAMGCLCVNMASGNPTHPGPFELFGAFAVVGLAAHSIICWRHRGIGAGMYSPVAALAAIVGTVATGLSLPLLTERLGEGWEKDVSSVIYIYTLVIYIILAGAAAFVWAAGRRWGRQRHTKQAGPPADIYASFAQAFEARFGRGRSKTWLSRGHIVAGTIIVLGWACLITRLLVPSEPGSAIVNLLAYSALVGGVLLFFALHVAIRCNIAESDVSDRGVALLLRPFQEDTDSTGLFAPSFETHLANLLSPYLTPIAIKSPDHMETFGASRIAYGHDVWQMEALRMMREAKLIILSLGETPGIQWEIEKILSEDLYGKTIFVVPEPSGDQNEWWKVSTSGFRGTIWATAVETLSDVASSVRAFTLQGDGSIRVVHIGEQSHRSRTIGVVLAANQLFSPPKYHTSVNGSTSGAWQMNWSRGLFRAWLALTVLWGALAGCLLIFGWPSPIEPGPDPLAKYLPHGPEDQHREAIQSHLVDVALIAVIPPTVLFLFGWAMLWIGRGFRAPKS